MFFVFLFVVSRKNNQSKKKEDRNDVIVFVLLFCCFFVFSFIPVLSYGEEEIYIEREESENEKEEEEFPGRGTKSMMIQMMKKLRIMVTLMMRASTLGLRPCSRAKAPQTMGAGMKRPTAKTRRVRSLSAAGPTPK